LAAVLGFVGLKMAWRQLGSRAKASRRPSQLGFAAGHRGPAGHFDLASIAVKKEPNGEE